MDFWELFAGVVSRRLLFYDPPTLRSRVPACVTELSLYGFPWMGSLLSFYPLDIPGRVREGAAAAELHLGPPR